MPEKNSKCPQRVPCVHCDDFLPNEAAMKAHLAASHKIHRRINIVTKKVKKNFFILKKSYFLTIPILTKITFNL